jgi:hypothetical protein
VLATKNQRLHSPDLESKTFSQNTKGKVEQKIKFLQLAYASVQQLLMAQPEKPAEN